MEVFQVLVDVIKIIILLLYDLTNTFLQLMDAFLSNNKQIIFKSTKIIITSIETEYNTLGKYTILFIKTMKYWQYFSINRIYPIVY